MGSRKTGSADPELGPEPVLADLTVGLTDREVAERRGRDGPNVLPVPRGPSPWRQLGSQFVHFFAVMLWIAGVLAFVGGLPQLGIAIFIVVVVNALFAFAQEYRAERAAERLRDLLPRRATVLREGRRLQVDTSELVIDDVVLLEAGDRISADLLITQSHSLTVDTSLLTGESVATSVSPGEPVFAGTFVVEGEARSRVTAIGSSTRIANIASLTRAGTRPRPPLALQLHRVVETIAAIAVGVGSLFFVVSLLLGTRADQGFVFAVGVTVALVPEALLPTVTLSLAIGAQRMARRHALVRRLEAVETLGSTTFICTDKTGTLTANQMAVVRAWTPTGGARIEGVGYEPIATVEIDADAAASIRLLALSGARCSSGRAYERDGRWVASGDPMEAAIYAFARRVGIEDADIEGAAGARFPFDPRRRRMSAVFGADVIVKGAPDAVLPLCRDAAGATVALERFTAAGLRVISVASRPVSAGTTPSSAGEAERDLRLLGLFGIEDPPRPGAADAVAACRRGGIRVAMVTGDHPGTALAVARETGLADSDALVLRGSELPVDEHALGALIDRDGVVIARVEPEEKLRIERALQKRGHVVAMTGDGVNDGPALQEADIGVAMGRSGTDVAREAADLVLLDDDFATIVAAVEQGRAIFANTRRFLTYHLTDNVAELTPFLVWALSGGRFPLALGVLQILALDIGTDTLSAVALGAEPPGPRTLTSPPMRGRLLDASVARRAFGLLGPIEAVMGMVAFTGSLLVSGWHPGEPFPTGAALAAASGAIFASVVIGQTANAFACRSTTRWPGAIGWFGNRLLVVGASIELVITGLFLFVPALARALGHAPPSVAGWLFAAITAPALLVGDALWKRRLAGRAGDVTTAGKPTDRDGRPQP